MPLPKPNEITTLEGWMSVSKNFVNEDISHALYENQINRAQKEVKRNDFHEAALAYQNAMKHIAKSRETLQRYVDEFEKQMNSGRFSGNQKASDEVRSQLLNLRSKLLDEHLEAVKTYQNDISKKDIKARSPAEQTISPSPASPAASPSASAGTVVTSPSGKTIHEAHSTKEILSEMGGTDPTNIQKTNLDSKLYRFQEEDKNYKDYKKFRQQAVDCRNQGKFEQALAATEEAKKCLERCKSTLNEYESELKTLMPKLSPRDRETMSTAFKQQSDNIDNRVALCDSLVFNINKSKEQQAQARVDSTQNLRQPAATDNKPTLGKS